MHGVTHAFTYRSGDLYRRAPTTHAVGLVPGSGTIEAVQNNARQGRASSANFGSSPSGVNLGGKAPDRDNQGCVYPTITASGLNPSTGQTASTRCKREVDKAIPECDRPRQHVRPGSAADKMIVNRQRALRAAPVADPPHAAVWRSALWL